MDVCLCVCVAIVRAWCALLRFVKGWRGDHTVSLGGYMTVFRVWCGLLCFVEHGRIDDVCLLGAMGGKVCRCGLCGAVLQDQSPGRECGENDGWPVEGAQVPRAVDHWGWGKVAHWWLELKGRQFRRLGCGDRR